MLMLMSLQRCRWRCQWLCCWSVVRRWTISELQMNHIMVSITITASCFHAVQIRTFLFEHVSFNRWRGKCVTTWWISGRISPYTSCLVSRCCFYSLLGRKISHTYRKNIYRRNLNVQIIWQISIYTLYWWQTRPLNVFLFASVSKLSSMFSGPPLATPFVELTACRLRLGWYLYSGWSRLCRILNRSASLWNGCFSSSFRIL